MFYNCIKFLAKGYISIIFKIEIYGLEHMPEEGPVIIAANHISNHDPIILGSILKRNLHFMAKKELFRYRLSNWFFQKLYAIPVDRQSHKVIRPIRRTLKILHEGNVFGIFPEGTRCKNGETVQPKKGVAFLGCKAGVPVLPVALVRGKRGIRQSLKLVMGSLIDVTKLNSTDYQAISHMIMDQITNMKNQYERDEKEWSAETI